MSHIIGGSAFGIGDALIDPKGGAVLLDNVNVVLVGTAGGGGAGRALAMELEGRVNKSQFRSSVGWEWTVMGGPVGDNQLPEVQDFVYLERDRTEAGFLSVGVHLAAGEGEILEDR
jgi:hypothetical protein